MLKQHQETIKGRNETQEKLKKECLESATELTANLVSFRIRKNQKFRKKLITCELWRIL